MSNRATRIARAALGVAGVVLASSAIAVAASSARMIVIPAGSYMPLYLVSKTPVSGAASSPKPRQVASFRMDVYPVTNADYLAFVETHPEWRRSRASRLFADAAYLRQWRGDLELGEDAPPNSPVVNVSWFAARAYLHARGEELPTVDQWEYAAAASETTRDASRDPAFLDRLLSWYSRPTPERLPPIGSTFRNVYGVHDLHGLIWEWTLDFNTLPVTDDAAGTASGAVCGAAAAGASDFGNYAAFMRYAFRTSLKARYAVANLGFRGVAGVRP